MSQPAHCPPNSQHLLPYIVAPEGQEALDFYTHVLGGKETMAPFKDENGRILHAEIGFENPEGKLISSFMFSQGPADMEHSPKELVTVEKWSRLSIYLYNSDPEAVFKRAKTKECKIVFEPKTQFWGNYETCFQDPYGICWTVGKVEKK